MPHAYIHFCLTHVLENAPRLNFKENHDEHQEEKEEEIKNSTVTPTHHRMNTISKIILKEKRNESNFITV